MKVFCTERLFDQKTYYEDTEYNLTKEEAERLVANDQGKRFIKEDGKQLAPPMKKKVSAVGDSVQVSKDVSDKLIVLDQISEKKAEQKVLKETEEALKKTIDLKKKAAKAKSTPAEAVEGIFKEVSDHNAELERVQEHSKNVNSEVKELYEQLDHLITEAEIKPDTEEKE